MFSKLFSLETIRIQLSTIRKITSVCSCPRLRSCCCEWEGREPVLNWFNHNSWVAVVTPNGRPKSVRNRCVIEVLEAFLCCHVVFLDILFEKGLLS